VRTVRNVADTRELRYDRTRAARDQKRFGAHDFSTRFDSSRIDKSRGVHDDVDTLTAKLLGTLELVHTRDGATHVIANGGHIGRGRIRPNSVLRSGSGLVGYSGGFEQRFAGNASRPGAVSA